MSQDNGIADFIRLVCGSFFRWWWAVVTGIASIAGWLSVSAKGLQISQASVGLYVLVLMTLLFLTVSCVYQSWLIYRSAGTELRVVGFQKSDNYGGEYVVIVDGNVANPDGRLVELRRYCDGFEHGIGLVEMKEMNSRGQCQGNLIWLAPGHHRDLRMGKLTLSDIRPELTISLQTVIKAKDQIKGVQSDD